MSNSNPIETIEADLVVAGGGGSGLAAAVSAAGQKVGKIIVLEALNAPGGNALFPEGFFAVNSQLQMRSGIEASADESFKLMMNDAHWRLNSRLVRTLINESGKSTDWLESLGVKFERREDGGPGPHRPPFPFRVGKGKTGLGVMNELIKQCKELGIEILCNTRAKQLITGEGGRVTGILAASKDKELSINTRCVVIATGGFAGNRAMIKKYLPPFEDDDELYVGALPHQGDGIRMAEESGAAMESTGATELTVNRFPWSSFLWLLLRMPNMIWVNKYGERYADEGGFGGLNNLWKQPGKVSYTLFDENIKNLGYAQQVGQGDKNFLGAKFTSLDEASRNNLWLAVEKDLQTKVDTGRIKISNDWADIAAWMSIKPGMLQKTITEYNDGCDSQSDFFAKDPKFLIPLKQPPYYAVKTIANLIVTHGVIKTSERMEVLDKTSNAIPGLYVAGADIGGTDENVYGGVGGHSFGFTLTSGYLAGRNAAAFIKQVKG
jgi:fumarate reductase flavoprotein subunit